MKYEIGLLHFTTIYKPLRSIILFIQNQFITLLDINQFITLLDIAYII